MIKEEDWEWYGLAGHFIGGPDCEFHLTTKIGNVIVSTVGEYKPKGSSENQWIGCDRLYETMVFPIIPQRCSCCDTYRIDVSNGELDFQGYNERSDAQKGHLMMCYVWAEKEDK